MTIPNAISASSKKPVSTITDPSQPPRKGKGKGGPAAKRAQTGGGSGASACAFLTGLVLVSFLGAGYFIYTNYQIYAYNLYSGYHDGDQILASRVADSFSNLLCQTYSLSAWTDGPKYASFYLTDGPATVSSEDREMVVIQNSGLRSEEKYDYKGFYLLRGSEIETSACLSIFNEFPTAHPEILLIKGTDHFTQWTKDASCPHCVSERVVVNPDLLCEAMQAAVARFVVEKADTYYVVITRQHRSQDDVALRADVTMKVVKTVYDVSGVKAKCLNSASCTFNLTYDASDDIIVEYPFQKYIKKFSDNSFRDHCAFRTKFFVIVFAVIPTCIIFLLTVLTCLCCRHENKASKNPQLLKKKAEAKAPFTKQDQTRLPPV